MLESGNEDSESFIVRLDQLTEESQSKRKSVQTILLKTLTISSKFLKSVDPELKSKFAESRVEYPEDDREFVVFVREHLGKVSGSLTDLLRSHLDSLNKVDSENKSDQVESIQTILNNLAQFTE